MRRDRNTLPHLMYSEGWGSIVEGPASSHETLNVTFCLSVWQTHARTRFHMDWGISTPQRMADIEKQQSFSAASKLVVVLKTPQAKSINLWMNAHCCSELHVTPNSSTCVHRFVDLLKFKPKINADKQPYCFCNLSIIYYVYFYLLANSDFSNLAF